MGGLVVSRTMLAGGRAHVSVTKEANQRRVAIAPELHAILPQEVSIEKTMKRMWMWILTMRSIRVTNSTRPKR